MIKRQACQSSPTFSLLAIRGLGIFKFRLQTGVLLLQLLDPHFKVLHLLTCTDTHLLDDFDKTPQTKNDDERGNLFDNATR